MGNVVHFSRVAQKVHVKAGFGSLLGCFRAGDCDETLALPRVDQQASSSYFLSKYR